MKKIVYIIDWRKFLHFCHTGRFSQKLQRAWIGGEGGMHVYILKEGGEHMHGLLSDT